jgi:hypothetical protein
VVHAGAAGALRPQVVEQTTQGCGAASIRCASPHLHVDRR